MTAPDEQGPEVDDYTCRFDLQSGWIDLTLNEGTKAEAEALAQETVDRLNPLGLEVQKGAVREDMIDRAVDLNEDGPVFAAAYYSENGVPLANLVVDTYGEEGMERPAPEEVQPQLLQWANGESVGDPEIAYLDLSAGPAVRVQSMLKVKRMLGFGRRLTEYIKYAVFPPGISSLVIITVTWEAIQHTEEITQLADELVSTMRLVALDARGNEITPNP
ncbi:hypothetical protein [Streptomyces sp. NPDC048309]|uniref:hypothetical protein n=1 Tax=unclassified Streptomyces TaxID=2593676 RepID=UPI0033FBBC33